MDWQAQMAAGRPFESVAPSTYWSQQKSRVQIGPGAWNAAHVIWHRGLASHGEASYPSICSRMYESTFIGSVALSPVRSRSVDLMDFWEASASLTV